MNTQLLSARTRAHLGASLADWLLLGQDDHRLRSGPQSLCLYVCLSVLAASQVVQW